MAVIASSCCLAASGVEAALKCYKVRDSATKAAYTADLTGLAPEPGCEIKVPASVMCVDSMATNGTVSIPDRPGGDGGPVVCYKIKCPKQTLAPMQWNDVFGVRAIQPVTSQLVCSSGTAQPVVTPPSDKWTTLISRSWTVAPGAEDYKCRRIQLPTEMFITGFRAIAPRGNFFTLVTVSDSGTPGDYDCTGATAFVEPRAIYGAGMGTGDFVLPPGVAVHVKAGQFLNLLVHVGNDTAKSVTRTSGVMVQTGSAAAVTDEAELIFGGTTNIGGASGIPSDGLLHTAQGGCAASDDYHVFALWPHMHGAGMRMRLGLSHLGVLETLLDTPYMVAAQQVYPMTPVLVHAFDQLQITCSYVNNSGSPVFFGDSSTDEQCFLGMYRYPVIPGANAYQCVS
ncbi:MAG TPA: hypothetical protein VMS22_03535 [Candidatus Eisenbacteria bacterium]|nr:hypothetical protein [Candidatus Eisenbacteria bacterium]